MQLDPRKLLGFRLSCAADGAVLEAKAGAKIGDKPIDEGTARIAGAEFKFGAKIGGKAGVKPTDGAKHRFVSLGIAAGAKIGDKPIDR